jgi:hypothetical protein
MIIIYLKKIIYFFFKLLNLKIVSNDFFLKSIDAFKDTVTVKFLKVFPKTINFLDISKSELRQDLFVLSLLNFKKKGYFIEFGAGDGMTDSNTFSLEKNFNWNGIVAEPILHKYKTILKHRRCHIEMSAVYKYSNLRLKFSFNTNSSNFSGITKYIVDDFNRNSGVKKMVKTISLMDLIKKYNAPKIIDYLSIDTEGSELSILSSFDFSKYHFKIITCEHNFTENRKKIIKLLNDNGYKRIYKDLSNYEDWFINKSFFNNV